MKMFSHFSVSLISLYILCCPFWSILFLLFFRLCWLMIPVQSIHSTSSTLSSTWETCLEENMSCTSTNQVSHFNPPNPFRLNKMCLSWASTLGPTGCIVGLVCYRTYIRPRSSLYFPLQLDYTSFLLSSSLSLVEVLKKVAAASIQDNEAVWFGCDVGQHCNWKKLGLEDRNM